MARMKKQLKVMLTESTIVQESLTNSITIAPHTMVRGNWCWTSPWSADQSNHSLGWSRRRCLRSYQRKQKRKRSSALIPLHWLTSRTSAVSYPCTHLSKIHKLCFRKPRASKTSSTTHWLKTARNRFLHWKARLNATSRKLLIQRPARRKAKELPNL